MGQVSVSLDQRMIDKGLKVTGYKEVGRLVEEAMREFIHKKNSQKLLELKGQVHWKGNLDELRKDRI